MLGSQHSETVREPSEDPRLLHPATQPCLLAVPAFPSSFQPPKYPQLYLQALETEPQSFDQHAARRLPLLGNALGKLAAPHARDYFGSEVGAPEPSSAQACQTIQAPDWAPEGKLDHTPEPSDLAQRVGQSWSSYAYPDSQAETTACSQTPWVPGNTEAAQADSRLSPLADFAGQVMEPTGHHAPSDQAQISEGYIPQVPHVLGEPQAAAQPIKEGFTGRQSPPEAVAGHIEVLAETLLRAETSKPAATSQPVQIGSSCITASSTFPFDANKKNCLSLYDINLRDLPCKYPHLQAHREVVT